MPPFSKKHLNTIMGDSPNIAAVAGRCPAAKRRAAIILAVTRILVEGRSFFLSNTFHRTNATKDIQKGRSITSSITPPYMTDAIKYGIVGFTLYESIITCESFPKKSRSDKISTIPPTTAAITQAINGLFVIF